MYQGRKIAGAARAITDVRLLLLFIRISGSLPRAIETFPSTHFFHHNTIKAELSQSVPLLEMDHRNDVIVFSILDTQPIA